MYSYIYFFFFFQAEDGIRDLTVTGVQTCALPIYAGKKQFPLHVHTDYRVREFLKDKLAEASVSRIQIERAAKKVNITIQRSEEHTSELQSQSNLVCRLLLEKKK